MLGDLGCFQSTLKVAHKSRNSLIPTVFRGSCSFQLAKSYSFLEEAPGCPQGRTDFRLCSVEEPRDPGMGQHWSLAVNPRGLMRCMSV